MQPPKARRFSRYDTYRQASLFCYTNPMNVSIKEDEMSNKAVYAARDFKKGEVVVKYELKPISFEELQALPPKEYAATHNINGQIYIYPEPARYVSHSKEPNTRNDHRQQADIALRDIKKDELITVDATLDDVPVLKKVDAILVKVPSIKQGLDFYREQLGMQTIWKKENMAAVKLGDSELVLSTKLDPETDILVNSVDEAAIIFTNAGGKVIVPPEAIDIGKLAIVEDPFGNKFTLVDLSKGHYQTDNEGTVIGVIN